MSEQLKPAIWKQASLFASTRWHALRGHIPFLWTYISRPCQRQRSDSFHHPELFQKVGTLSADSCYTFRFLERVNGRLSSRRHHLFICVLPDSISFLNIFFFLSQRAGKLSTHSTAHLFILFFQQIIFEWLRFHLNTVLSDIQTSFWLNERKRRERVEGNAGIKGCWDMHGTAWRL